MCLSQLGQITVLGCFCIYCCLRKIRLDALGAFVKSILSLLSLRIFVCLLFSLWLPCFCFLYSAQSPGPGRFEPNFKISVYRD